MRCLCFLDAFPGEGEKGCRNSFLPKRAQKTQTTPRLAALEEVAYAAKRLDQFLDAHDRNKDDASRKVAADYRRRLKKALAALNRVTGAGSLFDTADTRDA